VSDTIGSNIIYRLPPGAWLLANHTYTGKETSPVVLGPLHLATGRQYVYWEERVEGENGWVWHSSHLDYLGLRHTYRTVSEAAHAFVAAKRYVRLGRTKFRLVRFDGTPLLVVQGSRLTPWA
jgi:hypothetical protein